MHLIPITLTRRSVRHNTSEVGKFLFLQLNFTILDDNDTGLT